MKGHDFSVCRTAFSSVLCTQAFSPSVTVWVILGYFYYYRYLSRASRAHPFSAIVFALNLVVYLFLYSGWWSLLNNNAGIWSWNSWHSIFLKIWQHWHAAINFNTAMDLQNICVLLYGLYSHFGWFQFLLGFIYGLSQHGKPDSFDSCSKKWK